MLEARKSPLFEAVFDLYVAWLLKRSFFRIHLAGRDVLDQRDPMASYVLYGNHSAWWDALLPFFLSRRIFPLDAYAMMEEPQLQRHPFFRRIGVFSVDRTRPREAMRSLDYARNLLSRPGTAVWIFPEGRLLPGSERPIVFERGIERLAHAHEQVHLVPFAFHYQFGFERLPEAYIAIGPPIRTAHRDGDAVSAAVLAEHVASLRSTIRLAVNGGDATAFEVILQGKRSPPGRIEQRMNRS